MYQEKLHTLGVLMGIIEKWPASVLTVNRTVGVIGLIILFTRLVKAIKGI